MKLIKARDILSTLALVACFLPSISALSEANSGQQEISVESPLIGANAPQGENMTCQPPTDIKGWLLFTFDTATYGPGGFDWPFKSYFVLKQIGKSVGKPLFLSDLDTVSSFKVDPKEFSFIFQPKLSPDIHYAVFKNGDLTSSVSSFSLRLYDFRARKLKTIKLGDAMGYWPVFWSPNSRYLSYLTGGFGFTFGPYVPLGLWVYDIQSQQSHLVVRNENLINNIAWTRQNTLLVSLPGTKSPETFAFDPKSNQRVNLLSLNVSHPTPSPDGKWIAGFSGMNAKSNARVSDHRQLTLSLFPCHGGKPVFVAPHADPSETALLWSPDSAHLYRITRRHKSQLEMEVRFSDYVLESKGNQSIGSFTYFDKDGLEDRREEPIFTPLKVSRDGHYLFFLSIQNTNKTQGGRLLFDEYLKCLNLRTHLIKDICRTSGSGMDWQDDSKLVSK